MFNPLDVTLIRAPTASHPHLFRRVFHIPCGEESASLRPVSGQRILIVEDEAEIAEMLEYNLEERHPNSCPPNPNERGDRF